MNRKTANTLRNLLDDWLPPVVRESRPFAWVTKFWLGPNSHVDFKHRGFAMSDSEFVEAYKQIRGAYTSRASDTTEAQASWIVAQVPSPCTVLEVGPGVRKLTSRLMAAGNRMITLDLSTFGVPKGEQCVIGVAERLPFADKSVDITIVAHVIEHVRSLTATFVELERITRDRVLIVTPRQRFYDITFDYHLHFFYSVSHLASHVPRGTTEGQIVDDDLCLNWKV